MPLTHFPYYSIHFLKFLGEFTITPISVPNRSSKRGVSSKMGGKPSKHRRGLCEKNGKGLKKKKVKFIQEEKSSSSEAKYLRVKESPAVYEKEMMAFAFKKAEWKQEKKKLKEEVKMLRALVGEKEDKIRDMEEGLVVDKCTTVEKEWSFLGANFLVDQMEQERARRDQTVEKWKQLYLAIKMELDDLIQRTHEGGLYWRAEEEDMAEELKRELQAKEETINELKSKLVSMEQEMYKRDREVDILRQSLRIMTSKKVVQINKSLTKKTLVTQGGKL
ncbi:uncharacterized protein LOC133819705 [Humulus lupulus]|uniref:uncharacterized protein LOC133819705 n=1 Tax=Humulus lupulus TaxID=3486 RepID=UPI002B40F818|nr:uncharacterized protein LOC133819705 [Humulus lupulus]